MIIPKCPTCGKDTEYSRTGDYYYGDGGEVIGADEEWYCEKCDIYTGINTCEQYLKSEVI